MRKPTLQERATLARARAEKAEPGKFSDPGKAAKAIGCARTLVVSWEDGTAKSIGSPTIFDVARAYQVRPDWLAQLTEDDGYPWRGFGAVAESQAVRIDVTTLRSATATLLRLCEQWDIEFDPIEDADLQADFYARAVADGGRISGENVILLSDILKRRAAKLKETRDENVRPGRAGKNPKRAGRA